MSTDNSGGRTTLEEAGYLSGSAGVLRDHIRARHGALLRECSVASRTAMAVMGKGIAGPAHHRVALAAWLRSITACQAAVLLAERGLVIESVAILRTGFEQLFYAQALLKDPVVLERLRDQDDYERQTTARRALANADVDTVIGTSQRHALEGMLQGAAGNKRISVFEAAEIAGLAALYQTTYRQLSLVGAHATYTTIGKSFGESIFELQLIQDTEELPLVLGHIRDCLRLGSAAFLALQAPQEDSSADDATN